MNRIDRMVGAKTRSACIVLPFATASLLSGAGVLCNVVCGL